MAQKRRGRKPAQGAQGGQTASARAPACSSFPCCTMLRSLLRLRSQEALVASSARRCASTQAAAEYAQWAPRSTTAEVLQQDHQLEAGSALTPAEHDTAHGFLEGESVRFWCASTRVCGTLSHSLVHQNDA